MLEMLGDTHSLDSFPDSSVGKESACNAGDPSSIPRLGRSPGEGMGYSLQYSWASLRLAGKVSTCNAGDLGFITGLGRSPVDEKGSPLQYSDLENSMDCIVHGVEKSWTYWVTVTFTFIALTTLYFTWRVWLMKSAELGLLEEKDSSHSSPHSFLDE